MRRAFCARCSDELLKPTKQMDFFSSLTGGRLKVSIIVPVKEINGYVMESSRHIAKLDFDGFELIIFPDQDTGVKIDGVRIIATGPVGPAEKRDLAIKHAGGEILAFLDDDAYPRSDWLKKALIHFSDKKVAAVGGPAVTPEDDSISQKASGAVFASMLTSAGYTYRYVSKAFREVDDFPTVNLLVRKSVFEKLGGFDTSYWPGEDTKLCLDITKLGQKIIYEPDAVVYHHRRPLFERGGHFSQVSRYAYQRGYFVKTFPETSLRPGYFIPSLFLLFILSGPLFYVYAETTFYLWLSVMAVYAGALTIASVAAARAHRSFAVGVLVWPGILLTHLIYGFFFIMGLSARKKGLRITAAGEVF